ncbi:MAG TPA: hypothetical protein VL294_04670 [Pseudolysinimonas sp.]|nr:hypothetical protein [Pseudolysinimonas sp.]
MSDRRRTATSWLLFVLLAAEFLLLTGVAILLLIELLIATPDSYASAIALTVLAFIAAAWLGAIVVGAWRDQAWFRGAAIVWQVLQFALGAGGVTGTFANPAIGWPLVVVALVTFFLLLATRKDPAAS